MIDYINGFVVPKFKRWWGNFSANGALEQGGVPNQHDITDYVSIPYAKNGYLCNTGGISNTGFQQIVYERPFAAEQTLTVSSFWLKFDEPFTNLPVVGESDFYIMRKRTPGAVQDLDRPDYGIDFSRSTGVPKVCAIACRRAVDTFAHGSIEIWDPMTAPGTGSVEGNYTGTLIASTADTVLEGGRWYWCNIVFNAGLVSVYLDGTMVVSGMVSTTSITGVALKWDSYGYRSFHFADYVVQRGTGSAILPAMRVTTSFPTADVVAQLFSSGYSGSENWMQVAEGYRNAYWYSRYPDLPSYLMSHGITGQYDLYRIQRAYPVGRIVAVQPCILAYGAGTIEQVFQKDTGSILAGAAVSVPAPIPAEMPWPEWQLICNSAIYLNDPTSQPWDEADWVAAWQCGYRDSGVMASTKIVSFAVERLHVLAGGNTGNWYAY